MCSEISSLQSVKVIENYRELISTHSTGKGLSTHGVSVCRLQGHRGSRELKKPHPLLIVLNVLTT